MIAFAQHDDTLGGPFTPRRTGLDHLSFRVADEAVALNLRDPDGIALEFYVLRPR